MESSSSNLRRTAEHWEAQGSWEDGRGLYWLELEAVRRRLNLKVTGRPESDWVRHTLERHFEGHLPLQRCLSLGCGEGGLERQLASLGVFVACDAFDVAAGSIANAQTLARQAGYEHIAYRVEDANNMQLPAQTYDAVWASGAVHHFERLEHVFTQLAAALKPGGLFILNEYVGPSRFQFPSYQRQTIQACLDLLPSTYRQLSSSVVQAHLSGDEARPHMIPRGMPQKLLDKWRDGDLLAAVGRRLRLLRAARTGAFLEKTLANLPSERSVIAVDPSEAVRSAEIVPVLRQYFDILEFKPLGGTILQFLLADIANNFQQDEVGARLLEMLFAVEDALLDAGQLDSDFAYIVAAPKMSAA